MTAVTSPNNGTSEDRQRLVIGEGPFAQLIPTVDSLGNSTSFPRCSIGIGFTFFARGPRRLNSITLPSQTI